MFNQAIMKKPKEKLLCCMNMLLGNEKTGFIKKVENFVMSFRLL